MLDSSIQRAKIQPRPAVRSSCEGVETDVLDHAIYSMLRVIIL